MSGVWSPERRAIAAATCRARNAVMNQTEEHKAALKAAWARDPARRARTAETARRVLPAYWADGDRENPGRQQLAEMAKTEEHKSRVRQQLADMKADPEYRAKHSARMKQWWADRRASNG